MVNGAANVFSIRSFVYKHSSRLYYCTVGVTGGGLLVERDDEVSCCCWLLIWYYQWSVLLMIKHKHINRNSPKTHPTIHEYHAFRRIMIGRGHTQRGRGPHNIQTTE